MPKTTLHDEDNAIDQFLNKALKLSVRVGVYRLSKRGVCPIIVEMVKLCADPEAGQADRWTNILKAYLSSEHIKKLLEYIISDENAMVQDFSRLTTVWVCYIG